MSRFTLFIIKKKRQGFVELVDLAVRLTITLFK